METFQSTVEKVGMAVDVVGVVVIVVGILVASVRTLFFATPSNLDRYTAYRQNLGWSCSLLGTSSEPLPLHPLSKI
jgi:hypothetical protein